MLNSFLTILTLIFPDSSGWNIDIDKEYLGKKFKKEIDYNKYLQNVFFMFPEICLRNNQVISMYNL